MDSVLNNKGFSFSVEIARQGGKNELASRLELLLLMLYSEAGGDIVKCSPTFKPQTLISIERLEQLLSRFGFDDVYKKSEGYIIELGQARVVFLSADLKSSVVGHTAGILLEVDEAQDVDKDKFHKEFAPMASSTNATQVFYGTTWDDFSLLEEMKQANLDLQRKDGIHRHFSFPWEEVAKYNESYGRFVESERQRLGEDHPLFRTQYRLMPISGGGRLFNAVLLALIQGSSGRITIPVKDKTLIAGLDLAGQDQEDDSIMKRSSRRDSVVLSIAELVPSKDKLVQLPSINLVQLYSWQNQSYVSLYGQLVELVKRWGISRLIVDATGMGEPVASFLRNALGSKVESFVFSQVSKSKLGFNLLSFFTSGRLKLFKADSSVEYFSLSKELQLARVVYRPNQSMNFFVDPSEGHDDYLMSLALCVYAAADYQPRAATGSVRE